MGVVLLFVVLGVSSVSGTQFCRRLLHCNFYVSGCVVLLFVLLGVSLGSGTYIQITTDKIVVAANVLFWVVHTFVTCSLLFLCDQLLFCFHFQWHYVYVHF